MEVTLSIGRSMLNKMSDAPDFNRWMFSRFAQYIRWGKVWEVGSGIGNMSEFLLRADFLCLSEYEDSYRSELRQRFGAHKNVVIEPIDLEALDVEKFKVQGFDTIISTNVLEHILDHVGAVRGITEAMHDESILITLVPAHPVLFNEIDREVGHHRRYSRRSLRRLLEEAGHEIISLRYFNRLSALGWLLRKWTGAKQISETDVNVVNKFLPLMKCERFLPLPFGASVIAVSRKRRGVLLGGLR